MTVAEYVTRYLAWARLHHRASATEGRAGRLEAFVAAHTRVREARREPRPPRSSGSSTSSSATRTQQKRGTADRIALSSTSSRARKIRRAPAVEPGDRRAQGAGARRGARATSRPSRKGRRSWRRSGRSPRRGRAVPATARGSPRAVQTVSVKTGLSMERASSGSRGATWTCSPARSTVRHGKNGALLLATVRLKTTVTRVLLDLATSRSRPDGTPASRRSAWALTEPEQASSRGPWHGPRRPSARPAEMEPAGRA